MYIQEPVENLILWKTVWVNMSKLFGLCSGDIYHAKKHKKLSCNLFQVQPFFTYIDWANIVFN